MFQTALIVFREVLEASLIITIVLAATRGVRLRGVWVSLGVAGGILGASLVAACTSILANLFDGAGQDIVNAAILFLAVGLISWHILWMNSHGREIASRMRTIGNNVKSGSVRLSVLALVIGLAVMREGSEVVLMLQGMWAGGNPLPDIVGGAGLGLAAGAGISVLMYLGFLALPLHRVFSSTNILLMLIAAGMAARGANCLEQAGWVPSLGAALWDTSGIIADRSILGQSLAALIGYVARPSGIEVAFYVMTVTTVAVLMRRGRAATTKEKVAAGVAIIVLALTSAPAEALEVLSPYVVKGELELEQQGYSGMDQNKAMSGDKSYMSSLSYSPTEYWRTELEGQFDRQAGAGNKLRYGSLNSENTFQITEAGEYMIDSALFAEVDVTRAHQANNFVFGYLGAKQFGRVLETANLLLHKDVGSQVTAAGLSYSSQTKYQVRPWFEPGFEIYGDTEGKEKFSDQSFSAGPGIFGTIHTFDAQGLKYQIGYQFGATPATADGALRWKLEYEFYL